MNLIHRISALLPVAFVTTIHPAFSQEARPLLPVPPVPVFGTVQPVVSNVIMSNTAVTDVHLRPLFTTTIRVPDAISSVAVGAPTLFEAEHSDQEARLIYLKPTTNRPAESNLVVTMQSGETISMRLLSDGAAALNAPVDFIVDYRPRQSFFIGSSEAIPPEVYEQPQRHADPIADALDRQSKISTPAWEHGTVLLDGSGSKKKEAPAISGALGDVRESGGRMLVAYSVLNQSSHWIEVLPPQIEVNSPGTASELKKRDKKHVVEAEQIPVDEFRVNGRKLAPGQRADGVVTFTRPGFKQSQERILLQLASANSVDKPLLLSLPFVAPGK